MKAVVMHEYGAPEVLKFEEYPDPVAGAGEVLLRVAAAGINPVDTFERNGSTQAWNPLHFPNILGWDLAGTVIECGSGVKDLAVGDRVCAWAYHTYAEQCVVKAELLAKLPAGLDLIDAAALPLVTITGGQLITVASGVQSGQTVLVSGAAGGVGRSAVFAAKDRGAVVTAGVLKRQLEQAASIGADQVVPLDDDDAMSHFGKVDVIANTVRGKTAELLLGKVKPGGVFASVTGAPENAKDYSDVRVVAFVSKQDSAFLSYMTEAARDGKFMIPIDRRLPLADAAKAHVAVEAGGIGKVLLVP